ncbi:MAG TPA: DMT family transporter [Vicinamibacteria bacterium]|nr:DMT family transporter [Vicinamibacteria bacterium]
MPRKETLSGIGFMVVGVACFATMDAMGKWLVRDYSVFQLLALRSSFVVLILLGVAAVSSGWDLVRTPQPGAHLVRALCGVGAFLFFFTSVRFLPLADAVAVAFGGPFIVTALSVPLLGERVDTRQWIAIAVGFFGMLLVVRPTGEGFRPAALLVIASSFSYAFLMILTRWMSRRSGFRERTSTFLFYTFFVQALAGWTGSMGRLEAMGPFDWLLTAGVGLFALGGHLGITIAFQRAPVSTVAPFEYTALVWATVFGFVVFRDFPSVEVWLGVAIIVAAGLYSVHREKE